MTRGSSGSGSMQWTLYVVTSKDPKAPASFLPTEYYPTKSALIARLLEVWQPKTAVTRRGRTYTVVARM